MITRGRYWMISDFAAMVFRLVSICNTTASYLGIDSKFECNAAASDD